MIDVRSANGQFSAGNPGGPGRPRRAVESDYLAALADAVSIDDWRAVVARAVADAKTGDAKARDWLARYLLGATPPTLASMANAADTMANVVEKRRVTLESIVARLAADGGEPHNGDALPGGSANGDGGPAKASPNGDGR